MARKGARSGSRCLPVRDLTSQSDYIKKWQLVMIAVMTGRKLQNLRGKNKHHYFPSVLDKTIRYLRKIDYYTDDPYYSFIVNNIRAVLVQMGTINKSEMTESANGKIHGGEKKIRNCMDGLEADLYKDSYCYVPPYLHDLFNRLFAGEITPPEALLKLEWIFDERRVYNGENKENLIDFLVSVSVLEKKRIFTADEIKRIRLLRNGKEDVRNAALLRILSLEIQDVIDMLNLYFFHPYWNRERYKKHFLLLMFLKPPDRLKKTNISMYLDYYRNNGLRRVFRDIDEGDMKLLVFFLSRFSETNWGEVRGFRQDQHL